MKKEGIDFENQKATFLKSINGKDRGESAYKIACRKEKKGNYETAAFFYRISAEDGCAKAAFRLATFHKEGIGTPKDFTKAIQFYRMSANLGNDGAALALKYLPHLN